MSDGRARFVPIRFWVAIVGLFLVPVIGFPLLIRGPSSGVDVEGLVDFEALIPLLYFCAYPVALYGGFRAMRVGSLTRRANGLLLLGSASAFIAGFHVAVAQAKSRSLLAFEEFAERSEALVQAINRFQADTGAYPVELAALTPDYLIVIPDTGLRDFQMYEYVSGPAAQECGGNEWILFVEGKDRDRSAYGVLIYYPNGNYGQGNAFKQFGEWRHVSGIPYYPDAGEDGVKLP